MRLVFVIFLCLLFPFNIFSQKNDDTTFLIIGNQEISTSEFERIYNKNNSIVSADKQTVEEYLQMFINFKLKVQAAIDAGLDTLPSFLDELKGYRDQLAKSYLVDNSSVDSLIQEAYQRMQLEVNASHLMVGLKMTATPDDTLQAWNKAMNIRQRLLNGESFEKLAVELSDDPSAKNNKGNLGYFTAFSMVYPFESAAYKGKPGEISMPIRSRYGYHLIKTIDKRAASGEVKVAHIMLMVPQGSPDSAWVSSENRIKEIAQKLKTGSDFSDLARELSEDRKSARNGGELPPFTIGGMIPEFAEAAFKLQKPGDISEPVKTFYGWHLIKLLEKKGIPPFEQVKQEIKSKIMRDERADYGSISFINKLKNEYAFTENTSLLTNLYSVPTIEEPVKMKKRNRSGIKQITVPAENSNKINYNLNSSLTQQELFRFKNQKYKLENFINYLKTLPVQDTTVLMEDFVHRAYTNYVRKEMLAFENTQLENKYPDFKNLIQEYHDGILLFNLSDSVVWSKAAKDSVGLENFFHKNRSAYTWPERLEATIISAKTKQIAQKASKVATKLKTHDKIEKEITEAVCDTGTNNDCLTLNYSKFAKGDNSFIDSISWKKGISPLILRNDKYQFVVVHDLLKPSTKTLNECKGMIISDYQNELEKEWVSELRKKYIITINNQILNQLKNKYADKK